MKNLSIKALGIIFVIGLCVVGLAYGITIAFVLTNIDKIHTSWDKFEAQRSEKILVSTALRQNLGYGGMIHNFKNFVLRHDHERIALINSNLGAARSEISRYRTFDTNDAEQIALTEIESVINNYTQALDTAVALVDQGKTVPEIDLAIRVDDSPALNGLKFLEQVSRADLNQINSGPNKAELVSQLRKTIGYGGMIHAFKNLIMRRDLTLVTTINTSLSDADKFIVQYLEFRNTTAEQKALVDIQAVLAAYTRALATVQRLIAENAAPTGIDAVVKIDDGPALKGFAALIKEIVRESDQDAQQVNTSFNTIRTVLRVIFVIATFILLAFIICSGLLVSQRIVRPITKMKGLMENLAGGELEVEVHDVELNNEIGGMARAIAIFKTTAITQRQSETKLRDREARVRAIVDTVLDGIITINRSGIVETFNPAAELIFGFKAEEVTGNGVKMLMPESYHQEHDNNLANYLSGSDAIGIREVVGQRKNGDNFPMDLAVSEMNVADQRMFTFIVRDISERKASERVKREFVSTVSHELRTPLTSIRGSLGLILGKSSNNLPAKTHKLLEMAYRNSERLTLLINDLLDLEKLDSDLLEFELIPIDLVVLASQAVEDNEGFARQHAVKLTLITRLDKACVNGDSHRLLQVFANLISNAVKYSPGDATVEISIEPRQSNFRVAVRDYGLGIPEGFRQHIFQRFAQADSSDTRAKGGTGLGLSITKAIVERHQGTINYQSEVGAGTRFYFDLPMLQTSPPVGLTVDTGGGVLVCEDDPDMAASLAAMVQSEGWRCDIAGTAAAARALLHGQLYKLLLLDLLLPDGYGLELLRELRADPVHSQLKVIVVSCRADEGKKMVASDALMVMDWLQKPIDEQQLKRAIQLALKPVRGARILHVEDDLDTVELVRMLVEDQGDIQQADDLKTARRLLAEQPFDLVLLDMELTDGSGAELLDSIQDRDIPIIIFSGQMPPQQISERVNEALTKSMASNDQLRTAIQRILNQTTEEEKFA